MNRRRFLATLGASMGLSTAGCLTLNDSEYALGETLAVQEGEIALAQITPSQCITTYSGVGEQDLVTQRGSQYVKFFFDTSGLPLDPSRQYEYLLQNLQYRLSGETMAPAVRERLARNSAVDVTRVVHRVTKAFNPSETRLIWQGERDAVWDVASLLDASETAYLRDPPRFQVQDVAIPDAASPPAFSVSFTVGNEGGTAGVFGVLERNQNLYDEQTVNPSSTVTFDFRVPTGTGATQTVSLDWAYGERSKTVTIERND